MVVVAGLAALPAVARADSWQEKSSQDVDARGLAEIEIHNSRGRIDLTPSADGRIHITAVKIVRVEGSGRRAQELAQDIVVETDRRGDRFRIDVRYPQHVSYHLNFFNALRGFDREYEVRIAAEVPAGVAIDAHTTSGVIASDGMKAPQVLAAISGDVE